MGYGQIDASAAYNAFTDTYQSGYGSLTVLVTQSGNPVGGAEVLVLNAATGATVTANRTINTSGGEKGKAYFHFLKGGLAYQIKVRLGNLSSSDSVPVTNGGTASLTINL